MHVNCARGYTMQVAAINATKVELLRCWPQRCRLAGTCQSL